MKTRILAVLAAASAVALTACGSGSTSTTSTAGPLQSRPLVDFVEEAQAGADESLDPNSGIVSVEIEGSEWASTSRVTTTYGVDTANSAVPEDLAAELESATDERLSSYADEIFPRMEETGLTGVLQVEDVFVDENGELLWSQVFMQDTDGNVCAFDSVPLEASPTSCADVQ